MIGLACVADTGLLLSVPVVPPPEGRLDFGTLRVDCPPVTQPVRIGALGDDALVTSISLESGVAFSIARLPGGLPLMVDARGALSVEITFQAIEPGLYEDALVVRGRFSTERFEERVPLRGQVSVDGARTDRFVQTREGPVDVLFVIDNSCSMAQEQRAIVRNFASFISIADQGLADYQLGVITTDGEGLLEPADAPLSERIVSRASQPNPSGHFSRIGVVGVDGSGSERGLLAARNALSPERLQGPNFGFLRDDARLSLIFISDERDQSPGEPQEYASVFRRLKGGDPSAVSASVIAGDLPDGCVGADGERASPAPRYHELARNLGGGVVSICTEDWSRDLATLSKLAIGLRASFALTQRPDGDGLQVDVNGRESPRLNPDGSERWRYDEDTNSVAFAQSVIPASGSTVEIRYQTTCR